MNCTRIYSAEYTSKTTGLVSTKAVAVFSTGQELLFASKVEDVKAQLAAGKTKADVIVVEGQYGKYAAFSQFTVEEELA